MGGKYSFEMGASSNRVTTEPDTKLMTVDHPTTIGGRIQIKLTDCPGFNDPLQKDSQTIEELLMHLQKPGNCNVHAIVMVEKFDQVRLCQSHINFLEAMERAFGDKFFENFMIVL